MLMSFRMRGIGKNQWKGFGGAGRDRTDDILLAKQTLFQLSYSPVCGKSPGVAVQRRSYFRNKLSRNEVYSLDENYFV